MSNQTEQSTQDWLLHSRRWTVVLARAAVFGIPLFLVVAWLLGGIRMFAEFPPWFRGGAIIAPITLSIVLFGNDLRFWRKLTIYVIILATGAVGLHHRFAPAELVVHESIQTYINEVAYPRWFLSEEMRVVSADAAPSRDAILHVFRTVDSIPLPVLLYHADDALYVEAAIQYAESSLFLGRVASLSAVASFRGGALEGRQ